MEKKIKYRELCNKNPDVPIFSKDWWLDAVCGENNWDVVLVENGQDIEAALPYMMLSRNGFQRIEMPKLTQTMGPWINYPPNQKYVSRLTFENRVLSSLIAKLPRFHKFVQNFHYSITNWLPFYWQGFQQTTRYTYIIEDLTDLDKVWAEFSKDTRLKIKNTKDRYKLHCRSDLSLDAFLGINELTFRRQGLVPPYTRDFVKRLDSFCKSHNARRMFFALDPLQQIHAAVYIVWDQNSAYGLMAGADPRLRNSGAKSLCVWEAIKFASTVTKKFDFEGSMIRRIEKFTRGFGPKQVPYFQIKKNNLSPIIRGLASAKDIILQFFKH